MKNIRQPLRQKRRAIKPLSRERFAKQLFEKTMQMAKFQTTQKIALYLENDGEISPKYIQNFLKNAGFSVYLPVLDDKKLKFAQLSAELKKNKFGINEPVSAKILPTEQLDIIFIPLVGFDQNKNRIGMGGGFYDRTLAFKKQQKNSTPKLYGLAFDCQKVDKLEAQKWDVPLDAVITPTTIYR
ncbi:MAG: 5-formyltetrahydrofolate cyclo-ligase [Candidatus Thioglobus sp.]|nr:MAG: 5-formyltetrahydrofolate cyclo-ligase [Candidatus Thioglobus sp.]